MKNTYSPLSPEQSDADLAHFSWCALVALRIAQLDGQALSPLTIHSFLLRWLATAQKQRRFPRSVTPDIDSLLRMGRQKGPSARLHERLKYLWQSCSGDLSRQSDLFRLTYAIEHLKSQGWINAVVADNEWIPELSWSQQQRLHFMERQLLWGRRLTLSMVQETFDISRNQASRDIKLYRELAPENVPPYNPADQCYRPGRSFTPLFAVTDPHEILSVISHPVQNTQTLDAVPVLRRHILEGVLPAVLTAIEYRAAFEAIYASASTPIGIKRVLIPVAIAYVDNRLHLRALSEEHNGYRDFVLSRILTIPKLFKTKTKLPVDTMWETWVNIRLITNPYLPNDGKQLIFREYQLNKNSLYKVRAALVHHFLQTNVLPNSPEQWIQAKRHPWSYPVVISNNDEIEPYLFREEKTCEVFRAKGNKP